MKEPSISRALLRIAVVTSAALTVVVPAAAGKGADRTVRSDQMRIVPAIQTVVPETGCPDTIIRREADAFDQTGDIRISPPTVAIDAEAGSITKLCAMVSNRSKDPAFVRLDAVDLATTSDPDSSLVIAEGDGRVARYGLGAWFRFPADVVELAPGDDIVIPYSIRVPNDAPNGTSYGALRLQTIPDPANSSGVVAIASLAQRTEVTLPGDASQRLTFDHIKSPSGLLGTDASARFEFVAHNDGTTTEVLTPSVSIGASYARGGKTPSIKAGKDPVYRGASRRFKLRWTDRPWIGQFKPVLTVTDARGKEVFRKQLDTIYIIPWWFVAAIAGAIALILFGRWRRKRELRRYFELGRSSSAAGAAETEEWEDGEWEDDDR